MTFVRFGFLRLLALAVLAGAAPACAQDNLQKGKSPQELFASDCSICHKSPQGLAKGGGGGLFGLQGFLREHYTTSRETAAMLASYLEAAGSPPAAAERKPRPPRRTAKPTDEKPSDEKPAESKPPEAKPAEPKPAEPKPEVKREPTTEAKPESKPEIKPDVKPAAPAAPKESSGSEIKSGIAVSPAPADKPAKTE